MEFNTARRGLSSQPRGDLVRGHGLLHVADLHLGAVEDAGRERRRAVGRVEHLPSIEFVRGVCVSKSLGGNSNASA
jgi:hypothetical protein